jgi:hypothetical protein
VVHYSRRGRGGAGEEYIFQSTDNDLRIDNKIEFHPETRPRACSPDGGIDRQIAR